MKFQASQRMKNAAAPRGGRKRYGSLPGEDDIVGIMQTLRASGAAHETIAAHLNSRGIPTRMAGGRRWLASTIAKILQARA
jgi:hypothetical protein